MTIYQYSETLQMKDGIFRKVIETIRKGQTYDLSEVSPDLINLQESDSYPTFWQHIEKSFLLSCDASKFTTSKIKVAAEVIQRCNDKIKKACSEAEIEMKEALTTIFNEARDPYKAEITGIDIQGYKDGSIFGVLGLDRALPKNDDDLKNIHNRTVPFVEKQEEQNINETEAETPQQEKVDWDKIV